jgi:aminobutyraldehyde dehydrogenase
MMQIRQLINGQLVAGAGTPLPVMNPSTGGELIAIAEASPEQVLAAVAAADAAFLGWAATPPRERAARLLSIAEAIEAKGEEFARLESLNCGNRSAPRSMTNPGHRRHLRFFAGACRCLGGSAAANICPASPP